MSRRQPNMRTMLAAALLCIPQRDSFGKPLLDSSGFLVPCIDFAASQKMTEKQIRDAFDFDHVKLACWDGGGHPSNLVPRLRAEHVRKTAKDRKAIAKVNRAEKKREQMTVTNDLTTINAKLDKLPKHAPDRRKKAVIPGSRNSKFKRKLNGKTELRA
jgi:hypothetical protein